MTPVEQYLQQKLVGREQTGNLRQLRTQRAATDFFSNDYLGIATNKLLEPYLRGLDSGTGSTGSRLLSGNTQETEALEDVIAKFHHAEAALIFNSGYDANIGLVNAISNRHTIILYDELCHASIIDGVRLSQATDIKFGHNNMTDLQKKLERNKDKGPLVIITESVFSMDGDKAMLAEIATMAETYHAALIVDEAHATGVFGPAGRGLVCELGLEEKLFARVHTFGKAMGCHGAAVTGSKQLKEFLINFARPFIFTTALPQHSISCINAAYQYLAAPDFSYTTLHARISYFRERIQASGMKGWKDSSSPIQALVIGDNQKTSEVAAALQSAGLQINPIFHPTVPLGEERLRVCLHEFNTEGEIDKIFETLKGSNV
jgi:8-amino-7-oxononanoate synthase